MTPNFYHNLLSTDIQPSNERIADHRSITAWFKVKQDGLTGAELNLEPQHVCRGGCCKHTLRWDPDKTYQYADILKTIPKATILLWWYWKKRKKKQLDIIYRGRGHGTIELGESKGLSHVDPFYHYRHRAECLQPGPAMSCQRLALGSLVKNGLGRSPSHTETQSCVWACCRVPSSKIWCGTHQLIDWGVHTHI